MLRSYSVAWSDVFEITRAVTETPMTRAMGWRRVDIVRQSGKPIPLAATTGAAPGSVEALLDVVRQHAPRARVTVSAEDFPTLERRRSG